LIAGIVGVIGVKRVTLAATATSFIAAAASFATIAFWPAETEFFLWFKHVTQGLR